MQREERGEDGSAIFSDSERAVATPVTKKGTTRFSSLNDSLEQLQGYM